MQIQHHQKKLLAIVETLKEFKGMLWGQPIKVYTDHKNLVRDALGLTSDQVYWWRLLLEEYGPKIAYINGIHNTVADAISRLEYDPSVNRTAESYLMTKVIGNSRSVQRQNWLAVSKLLVQCRNRWHHQTWRLESCVCKSQRRGWNLPFHHNRDSRSAKKETKI